MKEPFEKYQLASSANIDFLPGLIALLKSIVLSSDKNAAMHFTILGDDLPEGSLSALEDAFAVKNSNRSVNIIDMSEQDFSDFNFYGRYKSKSPYFRLVLPQLLKVDDVTYIDSDVLIFFDIISLIDLCRTRKEPVSATKDLVFTRLADETSWPALLSDDEKGLPYFNSGIMHMKLSHDAFSSFDRKVNDLMKFAEKPLSYADQTILNHMFKHNVFLFDEEYNQMRCNNRRMLNWSGESNIHFTGKQKPFLPMENSVNDFVRNSIFYMFLEDQEGLSAIENQYFSLKLRFKRAKRINFHKFMNPKKYHARRPTQVSRAEYEAFKIRVQKDVFGRTELM